MRISDWSSDVCSSDLAIVQVFRDLTDDPKLGETNTLTGANWSCSVTAPVGNISLAALQLVGGSPSNRSAPRAFRIRPPALTTVDVTTPTETTVTLDRKSTRLNSTHTCAPPSPSSA